MAHVRVTIHDAWCKKCGICVGVCPRHVLVVDAERWLQGLHPIRVQQIERCTVCRNCELLCPDLAIEVQEIRGEAPS